MKHSVGSGVVWGCFTASLSRQLAVIDSVLNSAEWWVVKCKESCLCYIVRQDAATKIAHFSHISIITKEMSKFTTTQELTD